MFSLRRTAGMVLVVSAALAFPARADLHARTAPLDLTAGPQTIDLAAAMPTPPIAIVDRAAEQAGVEAVRTLIAQAAASAGVPPDFLLKLLRKESGLNHMAVSPKGALGIAQFMPATAAERGLADPFDPAQAIPKAAELLRDLRSRYGSWGLAAAAYNAGSGRIDAWLLGRASLPRETIDYVASITGMDATTWAAGNRLAGGVSFIQTVPFATTYASNAINANLTLVPPSGRDAPSIGAKEREALKQGQSAATPLSAAQLLAAAGGVSRTKRGHGEADSSCAALLSPASPCLVFRRY